MKSSDPVKGKLYRMVASAWDDKDRTPLYALPQGRERIGEIPDKGIVLYLGKTEGLRWRYVVYGDQAGWAWGWLLEVEGE